MPCWPEENSPKNRSLFSSTYCVCNWKRKQKKNEHTSLNKTNNFFALLRIQNENLRNNRTVHANPTSKHAQSRRVEQILFEQATRCLIIFFFYYYYITVFVQTPDFIQGVPLGFTRRNASRVNRVHTILLFFFNKVSRDQKQSSVESTQVSYKINSLSNSFTFLLFFFGYFLVHTKVSLAGTSASCKGIVGALLCFDTLALII